MNREREPVHSQLSGGIHIARVCTHTRSAFTLENGDATQNQWHKQPCNCACGSVEECENDFPEWENEMRERVATKKEFEKDKSHYTPLCHH